MRTHPSPRSPISAGTDRTLRPGRRSCFGAAALLLGALPIATISTGCEEAVGGELSDESPIPFPVARPEVKDVYVDREYVSEVRAVRYAEIRSRLKGVLEQVQIDEGQSVEEGQLLFSINARELRENLSVAQAAVASAEAELRAASLERDSSKLLFERDVVAEAVLALAEARVQILDAKLQEAKAQAARAAVELDYSQVRAPFAGSVNRLPRKAGSAVVEDELLTTMCGGSEVHAYFRLSEREALEYFQADSSQRAREVSLRLVDDSIFAERGVIDAAESEVDVETGHLALRARFPNPEGLLKHGSSAKVLLRKAHLGALLVPQASTFDVQGNLHVYVLDEQNTARLRRIVPRCRVDDAFVVESGLEADERFILEGVQKVRDGQRVAEAVTTVVQPD